MIALLGVVGFVALFVLTVVLNGLAFSVIWGWFVSPLFSLPALSIPAAIGLSMCISYAAHSASFKKGGEPDSTKMLVYAFVKPFAAILIGFIVKQFI